MLRYPKIPRRRTTRLLTLAAGATFALGIAVGPMGAGTAHALPDIPFPDFPQVTFDPCLVLPPEACVPETTPDPTVPDGPDDLTTPTTTPGGDETPDPTVPTDDTPVVPTAQPAPVVVAAPHFTG